MPSQESFISLEEELFVNLVWFEYMIYELALDNIIFLRKCTEVNFYE